MGPIWESKLHSFAEFGCQAWIGFATSRGCSGGSGLFLGIRIPQFAFILRGSGAPFIGGLKPSFFHGFSSWDYEDLGWPGVEQWVKSKVPIAKVRELLLQKRIRGVGRSTRCSKTRCHRQLDMKSTLPSSRWTGWNATYKHKRRKPQSRSTARGSKQDGALWWTRCRCWSWARAERFLSVNNSLKLTAGHGSRSTVLMQSRDGRLVRKDSCQYRELEQPSRSCGPGVERLEELWRTKTEGTQEDAWLRNARPPDFWVHCFSVQWY